MAQSFQRNVSFSLHIKNAGFRILHLSGSPGPDFPSLRSVIHIERASVQPVRKIDTGNLLDLRFGKEIPWNKKFLSHVFQKPIHRFLPVNDKRQDPVRQILSGNPSGKHDGTVAVKTESSRRCPVGQQFRAAVGAGIDHRFRELFLPGVSPGSRFGICLLRFRICEFRKAVTAFILLCFRIKDQFAPTVGAFVRNHRHIAFPH